MKYYVIQIATSNGVEAIAITPKEDFKEAKMLFHQICASNSATPSVTKALTQIIDENGKSLMCEVQDDVQYINQDE